MGQPTVIRHLATQNWLYPCYPWRMPHLEPCIFWIWFQWGRFSGSTKAHNSKVCPMAWQQKCWPERTGFISLVSQISDILINDSSETTLVCLNATHFHPLDTRKITGLLMRHRFSSSQVQFRPKRSLESGEFI